MIAHIDIETFSEEDLGRAGVYRYAEHPSTELTCLGYAFDDGEVKQWQPGEPLPADLVAHAANGGELRAHNAQFERVVLNGTAGARIGFPRTQIGQWTCTAAKVAASGLPRALGDAAKALGTHPKSDAGRIEMLQLSKPRRPTKADPSTRWTMANAPEKWAALFAYNLDDVKAERELDAAVPDLDPNEQRLYHLDQKINERGWKVDLEAVRNILFVVEQYKEQLAAKCEELTRDWLTGEGLKPTQREKIADWVRAQGFAGLPDMTAETIKWVVKRDDVPENVKTVLRIYSTYNAKGVSKLQAMLDAVCSDGRLRGMFLFYGAATGRWSSLIVQLQNMMRPVIKDPNTAITAFGERSLDLIRFLWPDVDPMKVAGSCTRGCLVADEGHDLVFPDFSGIEDRVNLWFFDEDQMLDVYRQYDAGKGRHPYSVTVCNMFGLDLAEFSDEDPRRQWGKVVRLFMGYEGGVAAFLTGAESYGFDLEAMAQVVIPLLPPDALDHAAWMAKNHPNGTVSGDVETACNGLKYLYRRAQPKIAQGWKNLKEAAEKAVEFEGEAFWLPNKKIAFKVETYKGRKWLAMRLPSGRKIRYFNPTWTPPRESERWINNELVPYTIPGYMEYWGIDTYTRQWMKLQTYGGKLDENADQGFSRDLLCNAMLALDAAGYSIVGSEHDKAILEVPVALSKSVDEIKQLMIKQPAYADGLPLAVDGKAVKRYGK
ncbi:MAG: hypothetical protein KGL39_07085 [Patescibacteria group bacterium]|nr:hypothetical protein [Patescibacteria group bacterium]